MLKFNNKGISLLETAITITVIMVGILVLSQIFPIAFTVSKSAEQATIATNLTQAKLEEMFYLGYDDIDIGTIEVKERLAVDPDNPFYNYQRETIVDYVDSNLNTSVTETGLKRIIVTTYYRSRILSTEKNVQIILIISEE